MAELTYPAQPIAVDDTLIGTPDGITRIAKDNPDFPGELFWDLEAANEDQNDYQNWSEVPSTYFVDGDPIKGYAWRLGKLYKTNPDKVFDFGTVADVTARDALPTPIDTVVYAALVTATGTYHRRDGAVWSDTGAAGKPVVPGDVTVDPSNTNGTKYADWINVDQNTLCPHLFTGTVAEQIEKAHLFGVLIGQDVECFDVEPERKVTLDTTGFNWWSGQDRYRPITITFDEFRFTHTDIGIQSEGKIYGGHIKIDNVVGPGMSLPYPAVRGGAERIGIMMTEGGHSIEYGTITECNIGILFESAWTAHARLGYCWACGTGLVTRADAAGRTNQSIRFLQTGAGGVYTSDAFGDDALRRSRSLETGADIAALVHSILDFGTLQYVGIADDSDAIRVAADCENNEFTAYLEGGSKNGSMFNHLGRGNVINFKGPLGGSNTTTTSSGIYIGPGGNKISGLTSVVPESSADAGVPFTGAPIIDIHADNIQEGPYQTQSIITTVVHSGRLFSQATPVNLQVIGASTRGFPVSNLAPWRDALRSVRFQTTSNADTIIHRYGPVDITGETADTFYMEMPVRNNSNTRYAQIAIYLLDESQTRIGFGQSITLKPGQDWTLYKLREIVPAGKTALYIRVVGRNFTDADTGMDVWFADPYGSFDIDETTFTTSSNQVLETGNKLYKVTSATFGQPFPEVVTQADADAYVAANTATLLAGDTIWVDTPSGHVYQFDVKMDDTGTNKVAAKVEFTQPTGVSYDDIATIDPADFPPNHAITTTVGTSAGGWINNGTSTAWIQDDASTRFTEPNGGTVDAALSNSSTNAVENRVVDAALALKAEHAQAQDWSKAQSPVPFAATTAGELVATESHFQTTTLTAATEMTFSGTFKPGTCYTFEVATGGNAFTINAANDPDGVYTQPTRTPFQVSIGVMGDGTPYVAGAV